MATCSVAECTREHVAKGLCKPCYDIETGQWAKNRKRYAELTPEKKEELLAKNRERYIRMSEEEKVEYLDKRRLKEQATEQYKNAWKNKRDTLNGFTPALVAKLLLVQQGACAICKTKLTLGNKGHSAMHRDHCHMRKEARGLLCRICNTSLGSYEKHQRGMGLVIAPYEEYLQHPPASEFKCC